MLTWLKKNSDPQWIQNFTEVGLSTNENTNICFQWLPSQKCYTQSLKFNYQAIAVNSFYFCCIPETGRINSLTAYCNIPGT